MEQVMDQPSSAGTKVLEMRRGAYWFFWIAALSVINSLAVTFGGMANMLFGLGATRVVDEAFKAGTLSAVSSSGLAISLAIAAVFAGFGYFARRGSDIAFILGMFLYVIDAMILIAFRDMFAFGFHMVAVFFLFKGLLASRRRLDPSV
jgi:hypothetical protein